MCSFYMQPDFPLLLFLNRNMKVGIVIIFVFAFCVACVSLLKISNLQPSTSAFPRFNDGNVYELNETNFPRQMTVTELLNRLTADLYV
jgi:hypothetical protein